MKPVEIRYSQITEKFPREFVLLQGRGCFWKKCKFCDYYNDVSDDPFAINAPVIDKITGEFGALDVINSGSTMELDDKTVEALVKKVDSINLKEIWFEVHWAYRKKLQAFSDKFNVPNVKYRTGIETFDPELRNFWNKGIPSDVTAEDVAKYFQSVCLLVGTERQTFETIKRDIELADKYFERYMINVFVPNSSRIKPNFELIDRFLKEIYPQIKDDPKVEISINNTDLGVG